MEYQRGFTVIELVAVIVLLFGAGSLFLLQKEASEVYYRDSARKTSINSIYYHLEEIYYPANRAYPTQINKDTLKGLAPELLQGPAGTLINEPGATLRYEPTNCNVGKCSGYILRADLENEADFIKESKRP